MTEIKFLVANRAVIGGSEDERGETPKSKCGKTEEGDRMSKALVVLSMALAYVVTFGVAGAYAADGATDSGTIALAAGLAIGIAAVGAALGQGRAVAAAMESIGRNPNSADKIQTPMIIGIAFIEALAIYALVIAFTLSGNV